MSTIRAISPGKPSTQRMLGRVLRGEERGTTALPPWAERAVEQFHADVLDPAYPCYFATLAEKQEVLFYSYARWDELESLPATVAHFNRICPDLAEGRRPALAIFLEPRAFRDHDDAQARFWQALQTMLDHDPVGWPEDQTRDTEDPMWSFHFAGQGFFVFGTSPTHVERRSRTLGDGMVLLLQPKTVFEGLEGNTPAGQKARQIIRERLRDWDGLEPHVELKDYGDPECREWKQAFLPDDQKPVAGRCPLGFDRLGTPGIAAPEGLPTIEKSGKTEKEER